MSCVHLQASLVQHSNCRLHQLLADLRAKHNQVSPPHIFSSTGPARTFFEGESLFNEEEAAMKNYSLALLLYDCVPL